MKIVGFYYNAKTREVKEYSKREVKKAQKLAIRFATTCVACALLYTKEVSANPFNPIGSKFWAYTKGFAFWACLIMAGLEIVKTLNNGDTKAITKIIFKYALAYGSLSFMPWLYKEIDAAFGMIK